MALRRWIQVFATFISNAYWAFPLTRMIYQGPLKAFCTPGLNCNSCPAATGACPLGALQNLFANLQPKLASGQFRPGLYVLGLLGFTGSMVGRMPCGWLCPFGLLQELVHKIPSPKLCLPKWLTHVKYIFLVLFVVVLPLAVLDEFGYGVTWFCKYICPAGTLEAGLPMLLLQPDLREMIGALFYSKLLILIIFLVAMLQFRRPFCRICCPLGAIYALFNKHSAFRMVHNRRNCTQCQACYNNCPMGVKFYESPNDTDCIRCLKCLQESCRFDAISWEMAALPASKPIKTKGKSDPEKHVL